MLTRRIVRENLKGRFWKGGSRSQGMVEFAVAAPILLMLIFGIIDFSLLFSAWLLVQNIARQAVRYAVTGQYELSHCPVGGCVDQADEDDARLESIYDEANRFRPGLLVEDSAAQDEPSYLKITVCTSDHFGQHTTILPRMGTAQYGDCLPQEHPGAPGDPVIVMVDFNHPYITPILNEVWPMVHLASYHEGVVEQFRVSRLINLPPEIQLPTATPLPPTYTYTPSDTPTITDTPTVTPTSFPIYLKIIEPYTDGLVYSSFDQTLFEAVAYDPNVGTSNGDGIERLTFSFTGPGPNTIPPRSEGVPRYCAFGGDGPCTPMTEALFNSLTDSFLYNNSRDYYMTVTAYTPDGRTATAIVRFKILKPTPTPTTTGTNTRTPTITYTPTITRTPTVTPTFTCSQFSFTTGFAQTTSNSRPRVTISLRNATTYYTVYIQNWTLNWDAYDASNPSQSYRRWYVDSNLINSTSDPDSTTSWSGSPTSALSVGPGLTKQLRFDFLNTDAAWPGIVPASSFGLTLTLDNGCVLFVGAQPTPTWTTSPTFTRTFTATNTVPTPTPTRTFTATNTVPTPTYTRTYTRTYTVPTPTYTNTFTRTSTVPTPTPTRTYTKTNTVPTSTYTITRTPTGTRTYTVTSTWTFTPSRTFTPTSSLTFTITPTRTPTPTLEKTKTSTPTRSPTPSNTYCFDC